MSLETITGNLRNVYKQIVPGTMLCVDQLMDARREDASLCQNGFYYPRRVRQVWSFFVRKTCW